MPSPILPTLCGLTLTHPPPPRSVPLPNATAAVAPAPLAHRDPYDLPNQRTSEHFALRWGSDADPTEEQLDTTLAMLEAAWDAGVDTLSMAPPTGSTTHYANVYLGGTGDDAPPIAFVGGYVVPDLDGAEMMVLHPDLLLGVGGDDATLQSIVTHEFFHVLQFASGALDSGPGPFAGAEQVWFWESTASWFAHEALPDNHIAPSLPAAYPLLPWLAVDAYDPDETDPWVAGRIYHSALFHRFLTEHVADASLMAEAWQHPDDDADPIDVLDEGLAGWGTSVAEVFPTFATHNVVLDYAQGELYWAWAESHVYEGAPDERISVAVTPYDLPATVSPTAPQRHGYAVIHLYEVPQHGALVLLDGDEVGSHGSPASYHVAWVSTDSQWLPTHGVLGGPVVDDGWVLDRALLPDAATLSLVVTAQPDAAEPGEVFAFRLTLDALPAPTATSPPTADTADTGTGPPSPSDTSGSLVDTGPRATAPPEPSPSSSAGCSCRSGPPWGLAAPWGLLVGFLSRRRRQRKAA